jgi:V/A-type H+-transporting ATPase subunit D
MSRYKTAPTKTNLFKLKRERQFAREGHALLEQKREILIAELMSLIDKVSHAQEETDAALKQAYYALERASVRMGRVRISEAALAVNLSADISVHKRTVIGVGAPVVEVAFNDNPPYYSLTGSSAWLDEAVSRFKVLLGLLAKLSQLKITCLRIAREVNKTVRRVNALEKIYLPDYEETIKYITDVLEEQDREAFFTLKLIKARLTAA